MSIGANICDRLARLTGRKRAYIGRVLRNTTFIRPMAPTLARAPPAGPEWLHEVKFDGWRAQLHVENGSATLYSKNGADFTTRFRALRPVLESIPARSAIIDCELVACDESGMPCFQTLMTLGNKAPALCLWCFDLLHLKRRETYAVTARSAEDTARRRYLRSR